MAKTDSIVTIEDAEGDDCRIPEIDAMAQYGSSTMTLTCAHRLRSLLAGLAILVVPTGASVAWGQGMGPDPFRPYNRQYDPYTYPMAPPGAEAGQFVGGMPRSGIRGANQYQNYLDELQGSSRSGAERYGIGMPYYRSSVDSSYDPQGTREYRPNRKIDESYEQSQDLITRKYLAYFTEKDPKKRAMLLKDYNLTRGKVSRALSARRENPSGILDAAAGVGPEARRSAGAAASQPRSSSSDRGARSNSPETTGRGSAGAIPPPPPVFGSGASSRSRTQRTPEDVLNRSRRLNLDNDVKPRLRGPAGTRSAPAGPATSDVPPPE